MKYWTKLLFALSIGSIISIATCEANLAELKEHYSNRFSVGLNLSHFNLDLDIDHAKINGRNAFSGLYLGYEHRKPDSIYVLFDAMLSVSDHKFHLHHKSVDGHQYLDLDFIRSSLLLGYTKAYCNWLFTPYLGFGGMEICNESTYHPKFSQDFGCFVAGMRCDYSFIDCFDLGLNLQIFSNCNTKEYRLERLTHNKDLVERSHSESWGLHASLPITYHFGQTLQWDLQIEPYYTVVTFKEKLRTYGANFLVGYNF